MANRTTKRKNFKDPRQAGGLGVMKKPGSRKVDHVGIYVGKGFFVHASFTNGIHIDSIANPYYFQRLVSIRKYRGF
ncbi:MAG: C40 family peptidase [Elusimicrobia bacterium]|nr:C40 family peptidase [Elusimicrobiota bacterium]